MRKSLLVGLAVAAPVLFASSSASAWGWGYGYGSGWAVQHHLTVTRRMVTRRLVCTGTAATIVRCMDTAATIVRACASMVRGRTVGVPEWASAEWDGAAVAAGSSL